MSEGETLTYLKRIMPGAVMCERLNCGKPAAFLLSDSPSEPETGRTWMVAYCERHAGEVGHAAMMVSPPMAPRSAPRSAGKKRAAPAA